MESQCWIELFGGLKVRHGRRTLTRFRTHKTAALLAFLAYHGDRMHSREVLVDMLWPEAGNTNRGRTSLSVALSSLRSQLEPPGVPAQSLLLADRNSVGLSQLVATDVATFERLLDGADRARAERDRVTEKLRLVDAIPLYRDVLLPGHYEAWIVPQQERLAERFRIAVRRLASLHEADELDLAKACAERAVQADPLDEDAARDLMRLLMKRGDSPSIPSGPGGGDSGTGSAGALRQFKRLEKALHAVGEEPSEETRALIAPLGKGGFATAIKPSPTSGTSGSGSRRKGAAESSVSATSSTALRSAERVGATAVAEPIAAPTAEAGTATLTVATPQVMAAATQITAFQPLVLPELEPLPSPLTRFYGRQEDVAHLQFLLDSGGSRLLTLTGPGGSGKTRLALETARLIRRRASEEGDAPEVHFVALQDADSEALLLAALCSTLNVSEANSTAKDVIAPIVSALEGRPVLLVLDNFEQVTEQGAPLLEKLLGRLPELTCLVTSRKRLPIEGEREIPVYPLPTHVPSSHESEDNWDLAAMVREQPALALFVDRAQLARPDFQITRRNAAAIMELTHRLEGIPLAIELAAARAQVLTPRQMLDRLDRRFDLLVSHRPVTGGRHHSLRQALQLSYELLSPDLQRFFVLLSLFRGGFTVEAAEAVAGSAVALDLLALLVDASLVRSLEQGEDGEIRFSMLETVREFARERLLSDEYGVMERDTAEDRHRAFYAELAEEAAKRVNLGKSQAEYLDRIEAEHDNCRAALRRVLRREPFSAPEADSEALRLATALQTLWIIRGYYTEGRTWERQLWARWRETPGRHDASLPKNRDASLIGKSLNNAGTIASAQGDHVAARRLFRRSLWLRKRLGDRRGIASTLNNWAISECKQENFSKARALYERSLCECRALGDLANVARITGNLGGIAQDQGDFAAAVPLFLEGERVARQMGNLSGIIANLCNLGQTYYECGNYADAERYLWEALRTTRELKDRTNASFALLCLGLARCARPDEDSKAGPQLLRIAVESHQELGVPLPAYAVRDLMKYPAAMMPGNGFSHYGLEGLQFILERWLPEHGI